MDAQGFQRGLTVFLGAIFVAGLLVGGLLVALCFGIAYLVGN